MSHLKCSPLTAPHCILLPRHWRILPSNANGLPSYRLLDISVLEEQTSRHIKA